MSSKVDFLLDDIRRACELGDIDEVIKLSSNLKHHNFENKNSVGKCPIDGRERPVYILINNKREVAISDGKGDCYMIKGIGFYEQLNTKCIPENKVNPNDYEYERGLSGFDF